MFHFSNLIRTISRRRELAHWKQVYENARLWEHGVDLEAFLTDPVNIMEVIRSELSHKLLQDCLAGAPCADEQYEVAPGHLPLIPKQEEVARRICAEYAYQRERAQARKSGNPRLQVIEGGKKEA